MASALVDDEVVPGDVEVEDGEVRAVGCSPAGRTGTAVPGFVDLQVNGFGGVDFLGADDEAYRRAGTALLSTGVTAYQPTFVSSPIGTLVSALRVVAAARHAGAGPRILGAHLEGPFLSPKWSGAHDRSWVIPPDPGTAAQLCGAGPVTMMTMAPEQAGGMDLLRWLVAHGIVVALGHTDADTTAAHQAFDAGARAVTHLFNAQRRFSARDPGVAGVALTRPDVTVGLIPDLVHLAPETLLLAWRAARHRIVAVTDAIAAAPQSAGGFRLGEQDISVSDAARLADGTLAGSVLSMDGAVRNLVQVGVPFTEAVRAASTTPARLMGREDLATLRPSTPADLVVLDESLHPARTVLAGREVWAAAT